MPHEIPLLHFKIKLEADIYQLQFLYKHLSRDIAQILTGTAQVDILDLTQLRFMSKLEKSTYGRVNALFRVCKRKGYLSLLADEAIFLYWYLHTKSELEMIGLRGQLDQRLKSVDHVLSIKPNLFYVDTH